MKVQWMLVSHLNLPRRQKLMLVGVFCLGLFTCVISIIRIPTLSNASKSQDGSWDNVDAAIWSFLELTIAILAACLPTLRPIFVKVMPVLFGNSSRGTTDRPAGDRYISPFPHSSSGKARGGSTWLSSKPTPSSQVPISVIKESGSTEELHSGAGWLPRGSGAEDDLEYGLQDLGPRAGGHDGQNYTIVVSAGRSKTPTESNALQEAGIRGGITATTMIIQQVESGDSDERSRSRGAR